MVSNEEEFGFFEDIDNGEIILSYSKQNLPNYSYNNHKNSLKKKRDSYDERDTESLMDSYYDYVRRIRINFLYCIQCCYPIFIVGTMLSLFTWILYTY